MENASKALIMAGEILISILILSAMVYLFSGARSLQNSYEQKLSENQIQTFNSNFTKYEGEEVTAYEIVSLINFANEYNQKVENDDNYKITINIDNDIITDYVGFLNENKLNKYKMNSISYNNNTHLVKEVFLKKC